MENTIEFHVSDRILPTDPHKTPMTLALNDANDIFIDSSGDLARVSGINAAKLSIKTLISMQKGEWFLDRSYGSVFGQYFVTFKDNLPLLERLFKLEIARLSSIPFAGKEKASLSMIKRIQLVKFIKQEENNLYAELTVEWGNGEYSKDNYVFWVPTIKQLQSIREKSKKI